MSLNHRRSPSVHYWRSPEAKLFVEIPRDDDQNRPLRRESLPLYPLRVTVKTAEGETTSEGLYPSVDAAIVAAQIATGSRSCQVSVQIIHPGEIV